MKTPFSYSPWFAAAGLFAWAVACSHVPKVGIERELARATNGTGTSTGTSTDASVTVRVLPPVPRPTLTPEERQQPARPLEVRLADIRATCLSRDWTKRKCIYEKKFGELYERFGAERFLDPFEKIGMGTFSRSHSDDERKIIGDVYGELGPALKKLRADQQLSNCQSACLVACVTSKLSVYDFISLAKGFETEDPDINILIRGAGVCRHYAVVADRLATEAGLKSKHAVSFSGNHAFLGVKDRDEWIFIEPQTDRCLFYRYDTEKSGRASNPDAKLRWENWD